MGVVVFYVLLFAYSEYQAKNTYDDFYSSSARSLAFANKLLGTSLGFSSDKLSLLQDKKAKDLLRLLSLNANAQCLSIQGESYALFYPPGQFCFSGGDPIVIQDKLQKSSELSLKLYIDGESVSNVVDQNRLVNYIGGTLLVLGALASASIYSYRKALRQRYETDRLIDKIIASSPNPYIIVDQNFRIASISDSLSGLLLDTADLQSTDSAHNDSSVDLTCFFSSDSAERIVSFLSQLNIDEFQGSVSLRDLNVASKKTLVFASSISVIRNSTTSNFFFSLFDETQSSVQKSYLAEQLSRDSLTGAFSRRYLFETYGGVSRKDQYCLFLIDLDDFRDINDSYGHDAGDQLLFAFSSVLAAFSARHQGEVYRLGGDEFVVLLKVSTVNLLSSFSESLHALSEISFLYMERPINKTFSFGSTVFASSECLSDALKRADEALIQAKKSGKKTYVVAEKNKLIEGLFSISHQASLSLAEIEEAFNAGHLELYLQPVFNTVLSSFVGYEALVRLHRDSHMISPAAFLDSLYKLSARSDYVIDHYDLLADLFVKLPDSGDFWISYNVNEVDLGDNCFERLLDALKCRTGDYKDRIVLEISETTFQATQYSSSLLDRISLLKSKGFRLALDDFGVLSSNIFALSNLPVDIVKLDKFLVTGIRENLKNQRIIESLRSLAESLDFELIAEGIEATDEAACLEGLGIVLHQGFLYGRPAPITDFLSSM